VKAQEDARFVAYLCSDAASCFVEEESTLFNLTPIRGPYYVELDLDNDAYGI
jgi:hypothetical protein